MYDLNADIKFLNIIKSILKNQRFKITNCPRHHNQTFLTCLIKDKGILFILIRVSKVSYGKKQLHAVFFLMHFIAPVQIEGLSWQLPSEQWPGSFHLVVCNIDLHGPSRRKGESLNNGAEGFNTRPGHGVRYFYSYSFGRNPGMMP